jgi:large subunit ribosomal protein L28
MARVCETCGKRTKFGRQLARRGLAKYKGGVGIKTTGVTKRRFKPNIQRVRVLTKEGTVTRIRVCTKCIRSGKIRKPFKREIPEGLRNRMRALEEAKEPGARRLRARKRGERRRKRKAEAEARAEVKATKPSED